MYNSVCLHYGVNTFPDLEKKFVNTTENIKFQAGSTRPLNFTFKPGVLNPFCVTDPSDSLTKPTDPFSEKCTINHLLYVFGEKFTSHSQPYSGFPFLGYNYFR